MGKAEVTLNTLRILFVALILLTSVGAQSLPVQPLNFSTSIEVKSTIEVDKRGNALIETRLNISASEEFNRALSEQLSKLEDREAKATLVKQLEAVLTLLGYEVEKLDIRKEDGIIVYSLKIKNFATRLNDTWIIKPQIEGLQAVNMPVVTFAHYRIKQEIVVALPRGAEVLMVAPRPYEKEVGAARASLKIEVAHGYAPEVRYSYSADLPPGTNLAMLAEQEPLRIIYAYTTTPLSSPAYLALSALIILVSITIAYRMKVGEG